MMREPIRNQSTIIPPSPRAVVGCRIRQPASDLGQASVAPKSPYSRASGRKARKAAASTVRYLPTLPRRYCQPYIHA
ncbi:hypothetical protein HYQ46_002895 [Verticillium longisporum]|nr:hypothetical protein HYQ44_005593 [Verticillium longisporum]KAG7148241.1 hypothetical protein HYQ46_002895 [Verticillium longisporum]